MNNNFDAAQARHDANMEPRDIPRCAPGDHEYYPEDQFTKITDGLEIECQNCESVVVANLVEIQ